MLSVKNIRIGELKSNCYVVGNEKECIVIDPGSDTKDDMSLIKKAIGKRKLLAVLITHAHFDHIDGAHLFNVPVYVHEEDVKDMKQQQVLSKVFIGKQLTLPQKLETLKDKMSFGDISFTVLHTPGHTPGGVCFLFDKFIFTGDTLFKGTYGRTDVGGNDKDIKASLKMLAALPSELVAYPGHGRPTTIGKEKDWIKNI